MEKLAQALKNAYFIIPLLIILVTVLIKTIYRKRGAGRVRRLVLCGPPGSGKTKLFYKIAGFAASDTVTSFYENECALNLKNLRVTLVDVPGFLFSEAELGSRRTAERGDGYVFVSKFCSDDSEYLRTFLNRMRLFVKNPAVRFMVLQNCGENERAVESVSAAGIRSLFVDEIQGLQQENVIDQEICEILTERVQRVPILSINYSTVNVYELKRAFHSLLSNK